MKAQNSKKIEELKTKIENVKPQNNFQDKQALETFRDKLNDNSPKIDQLKQNIDKNSENVSKLRQQLFIIKSNKNNSSQLTPESFHRNMNRVLEYINRYKEWKHKPIGPFGFYCSIKSSMSMWSDVLESYLGIWLNAFWVSEEEDQRKLNSIMRECEW